MAPSTPGAPAASTPATGKPSIYPIFVSSEILAGKNRFLFSLTDAANKLVAAPDVPVTLEFFDVGADENRSRFTSRLALPVGDRGPARAIRRRCRVPEGRPLGRAFHRTLPRRTSEQVRADFDVAEIGLDARDRRPGGVHRHAHGGRRRRGPRQGLDGPAPDPAFYRTSVADALTAQEPFVLAFATPAFCQTAMCGPLLENVKTVAADYPTLTFINVEPYMMAFTEGRLQPVLADGQLQAAAWTDAWGLRSEPWIFVIDGDGKVTAKFEGAVAEDELRDAFDAVAPANGSVEGLVTAVDQASVAKVNSFTLRTNAGEEIEFGVGTLDLTDGGFNAGHLREHMATGTPISVRFGVVEGLRTAVRLTDAE